MRSFDTISEAGSGQMNIPDILSAGVVLGALISFGIISFALTADVLREYLLNDVVRTYSVRSEGV